MIASQIILFSAFAAVFSLDPSDVPVLVWKETGALNPRAKCDEECMHKKQDCSLPLSVFKKDIVQELYDEKNIVVFLQDSLSPEDFSFLGSAFPFLEQTFKTSSHLYLPHVQKPSEGLKVLEQGRRVIYVKPKQEGINLKNDTDGKGRLIIVPLATDEELDRSVSLQRSDKVISQLSLQIAKFDPEFVAIFTGLQPSWIESEEKVRVAREAVDKKPGNNTGPVLNYTNCVYLYADSVSIRTYVIDGKPLNQKVKLHQVKRVTPTCGKDQATIDVTFEDTDVLTKVTLRMEFKKKWGNSWRMSGFNVTFTAKVNSVDLPEKTLRLHTNDVVAPMNMSFQCQDPDPFATRNPKEYDMSVSLIGLQVQWSGSESKVPSIGEAETCSLFMTVPILSGLFITLIFAIIMWWALSNIMSITTIDQFDDPKGKTITVPQTSE